MPTTLEIISSHFNLILYKLFCISYLCTRSATVLKHLQCVRQSLIDSVLLHFPSPDPWQKAAPCCIQYISNIPVLQYLLSQFKVNSHVLPSICWHGSIHLFSKDSFKISVLDLQYLCYPLRFLCHCDLHYIECLTSGYSGRFHFPHMYLSDIFSMFQDFTKLQEIYDLFNFQTTFKLQTIGRCNSKLIVVHGNPIEP